MALIFFAIGSDWEGYFDYLNEFCEVVYLPRTEGISSTQLRQERPTVNIGIIGTGSIASRFVPESESVNSANITAAYNPNWDENKLFCEKYNIPVAARSLDELYNNCNAVYIASPHYTHYNYVKSALEAGKHVLCETPFVFSQAQAEELYQMAEEKNLVLMVALKTAFTPAFGHLSSLLKSRVIGDIVEVNCDYERKGERRHGWIRGIVVQSDPKMIAVQFRANVYLTDGWMVPDHILWYPITSPAVRPNTRE